MAQAQQDKSETTLYYTLRELPIPDRFKNALCISMNSSQSLRLCPGKLPTLRVPYMQHWKNLLDSGNISGQ